MDESEQTLIAEGLTRTFGSLVAVDNVSFQVRRGEVFGLVGPDGAGKSTTLRMLASILDPTSGTARVAGFDTQSQGDQVKENLAYMSQRFGLYPDLTVQENVHFYADLYGLSRRERDRRLNELLDFSYMRPFRNRLAAKLSGGMKQKLQLICALIHTPRVLLLDEPTNGVDPVSRRDFWRILYQLLKQEVTILVSTSYLDEAERCNRVGFLDHGRLLNLGSPVELKRLMPGRILGIQSSQARNACKVLERHVACESSAVFGDRVHLVCRDLEGTLGKAREALENAGVPYGQIGEEKASLEDVFVSLLGESREIVQMPPGGVVPAQDGVGGEALHTSHPEMGLELAVRVTELSRHFGDFIAVNRLSFEVPQGQIFGFLGPNGAGKSTTIRMLCGLLTPSGGEGTVGGFDVRTQAEEIKRNIGYMSQKFSLYDDLKVEENLNFFGGIYGLKGDRLRERKDWAVEMAGLAGLRDRRTVVLSSGWKQRLALACSILHDPPILFLDEPTSGVDPLSRRRFWDLIYDMSDRGLTVFVSTHYMEEAEYCDRLALIYRANMIAIGTPQELKTRYNQDEILSIQCPRPQEILDTVAQLPEVREVALFGAGLHAVVKDAVLAERAIRAGLERLGAEFERIEKVSPSMEDTFVSLIEEVDRRDAAANGEQG
jgi:ABC-2 type transport system ATP-binding protein